MTLTDYLLDVVDHTQISHNKPTSVLAVVVMVLVLVIVVAVVTATLAVAMIPSVVVLTAIVGGEHFGGDQMRWGW